MKVCHFSIWLLLVAVPAGGPVLLAQQMDAKEIIRRADEKMRGKSSVGEMKMTIKRPTWSREVTMKAWTKGEKLSLILVTNPVRDRGAAFLKRDKEIWNWQPTIDRVIKLPPSMMMQSWMGSDFTNDDLVKESSVINDYNHRLIGSETLADRECYKIELKPREEAAVVWGKVLSWIDKKDFLQMKAEFYDEDGYLVNTMLGKQVKMLGGKLLTSVMEVIPADEPGNRTIIEYLKLEFDKPIDDAFFSVQNMKKVK